MKLEICIKKLRLISVKRLVKYSAETELHKAYGKLTNLMKTWPAEKETNKVF